MPLHDFNFGSNGVGQGQFTGLCDFCFHPTSGDVWTLETRDRFNLAAPIRVQRFSASGAFVSQFSVARAVGANAADNVNAAPFRVAVDAQSRVYISRPKSGVVDVYSPSGTLLQTLAIPDAACLCAWQENGQSRVGVVTNGDAGTSGFAQGGTQIVVINDDLTLGTPVTLSQQVRKALDFKRVVVNGQPRFYVQGLTNQIYAFDATSGALVQTFGIGNSTNTAKDGSELLRGFAVAPDGTLYGQGLGNPGVLYRFDSNGRTYVVQSQGQWKVGDSYTNSALGQAPAVMQLDGAGRLWLGTTFYISADNPMRAQYAPKPALLRIKPAAWETTTRGAERYRTQRIGLAPKLGLVDAAPDANGAGGAAYGVSYGLGPLTLRASMAASQRFITNVNGSVVIRDDRAHVVETFDSAWPLANGQEATLDFAWTPRQYGGYSAQVSYLDPSDDSLLLTRTLRFCVTPDSAQPDVAANPLRDFSLLPKTLAGENDADSLKLQNTCGLPFVRFKVKQSGETGAALAARFQLARTLGMNPTVQWESFDDVCTADPLPNVTPLPRTARIQEIVAALKPYSTVANPVVYALVNEPGTANVSGTSYGKMLNAVVPVFKSVDPNCKISGPNSVNVWGMFRPKSDGTVDPVRNTFFKELKATGFMRLIDWWTIHDYEGNEGIRPPWFEKIFTSLQSLLQNEGFTDPHLSQTEREIACVRGGVSMVLWQAVNYFYHRAALERVGIPIERDHQYYFRFAGDLGQKCWITEGSGGVSNMQPLFAWIRAWGAATRSRQAGQKLSLGTLGDTMAHAIAFAPKPGDTTRGSAFFFQSFTVENYPVTLNLSAAVTLYDQAGNARSLVPDAQEQAQIEVGTAPVYVVLPAGATLSVVPLNKPAINHARAATASACLLNETVTIPLDATQYRLAQLKNGITEVPHAGNAEEGNAGDMATAFVRLPGGFDKQPTCVGLDWATSINAQIVVLRGFEPDNGFDAILEAEAQYLDAGGAWQSLGVSTHRVPESVPGTGLEFAREAFHQGQSAHWWPLPSSVATKSVRVLVTQVTSGWAVDDDADATYQKTWNVNLSGDTMISEIEVWGA